MNEPSKKRKYATLDHRHEAEQDAIGFPRFFAGNFVVKIRSCYAVDGDPKIWKPEDVTYFVAEFVGLAMPSQAFIHAHWVNRLRFNGMAQLKEFMLVALNKPWGHHESITEAVIEEAVSEENPLADALMWLHVSPPKEGGYMHHAWKRPTIEEVNTWSPLIDAAQERAGG